MPSVPNPSWPDELVEAVAAVRERAGQVLAEQPVQQEGGADERQRDAHHAARGLEDQHDGHDADHHVPVGQFAGALDQVGLEDPVIEAERRSRCRRRSSRASAAPARRQQQEGHQQQEADVHRAHHRAGQRAERSGDDLEGREDDGDREYRRRDSEWCRAAGRRRRPRKPVWVIARLAKKMAQPELCHLRSELPGCGLL